MDCYYRQKLFFKNWNGCPTDEYEYNSVTQECIDKFLCDIVDVLKYRYGIDFNSFEMTFGQVVIVDIKKVIRYFNPKMLVLTFESKYIIVDYVFKRELFWFENCVLLYIQLTFANLNDKYVGLRVQINERMDGWFMEQMCDSERMKEWYPERMLEKGMTFDNLD